MVVTRRLYYLFEGDRVGSTSLLLVNSIDRRNKLAIMMLPTILLALFPPSAVLAFVCGLGLVLALVLVEVCPDSLLAGGLARHKVE